MKKLLIYLGTLVGVLYGVELLNTAILLHFHELSFYYTWNGLWRVTVLVVTEAVVLYPFVRWLVDDKIECEYRKVFHEKES